MPSHVPITLPGLIHILSNNEEKKSNENNEH